MLGSKQRLTDESRGITKNPRAKPNSPFWLLMQAIPAKTRKYTVILRETLEGNKLDHYKRQRKHNINFALNTGFSLQLLKKDGE